MRFIETTVGIAAALCTFAVLAADSPTKASPPAQGSAVSAPAVTPPPETFPPSHTPAAPRQPAPAKSEKMVDLNNASKAELMTLPSVGEAEAVKIIANRPYVSKVDLVTKAGLPEGLYVAVRHKVVVNDTKKATSKQAAPKT